MCEVAVLSHVRVGRLKLGAEEESFFEIRQSLIAVGL